MKKLGTRAALAAAVMTVLPSLAAASITVQTTTNATTMVNALVPGSSGIQIVDGSANYTGASNASGTFTNANFLGNGFNSGIVLTSGDATKLDGPNTGESDYSTDNGFANGNSKLDNIVSPRTTHNASTLMFKFVPSADVISFQFVFGSDEYSEFVGSQFNDVFGFFLDGENIALVPGTTTPVAINNVNNGNPSNNTPASNASFFTDNDSEDGANLDTKLDGLVGQKKALFAVGDVTPGEEHTIEITIADTTDSIFDSAVFLLNGSFGDEPPPPPVDGGGGGGGNAIPLPAGVWAGMSMLSGLGVFSKIKRLRRRVC
jgi:hypothetical protein